jgi:hypothetical protein
LRRRDGRPLRRDRRRVSVARITSVEAQGDFDGLNAAHHLGVATGPVIAVNVMILLGAWIFLLYRIQSGHRLKALAAIAAGTIGGFALYTGWLGPWLLP